MSLEDTGPGAARTSVLIASRERIRQAGRALGFSRVGFALPDPGEAGGRLRAWLDRSYHGTMAWMERDPERRADPRAFLPAVRSVVAVALPYLHPRPPEPPGAPRISCYAWGDDYHDVMSEKLHAFVQAIRTEHAAVLARDSGDAARVDARDLAGEAADRPRPASPEAPVEGEAEWPAALELRLACDTSPVMDKAWAQAAGLGWIGKNTCLIDPRGGSWLFLGEVFTNLPWPPDDPGVDRCGSCRRCLDACPTRALAEPYVLDARRCISYLTIEHRRDFDPEESAAIGEWIVGCDICQEVCPWNRKAVPAADQRFAPRPGLSGLTATAWASVTDEEYRRWVQGTAIRRVKPAMMRRNAEAVRARPDSALPQ